MKAYYEELTTEKFKEIYSNERFRNEVAFAHHCCDSGGHFEHYGTCSHPQQYKVTEQQIVEAKRELRRAKKETYNKCKNCLLFVGMGLEYSARYEDDVCNYRIRTEFLNRNHKRYFIEFVAHLKDDCFTVTFAIDRDMEIKLAGNSNRQHEYYNYKGLQHSRLGLKYTKTNILNLVNEYFDCSFREIVIDQHNIHPDDREIICESPEE